MRNYAAKGKLLLLICGLLGCINSASAGIVIDSTRVIYKSNKDEVTVKLTNTNAAPVLVQNWLDTGDEQSSPNKISVPFVLTPPINRIDAGKGQTIRINYLGTPALPTDKESVFWLNVLEIPAKQKNLADKNKINVAFRTRIKLFYRPEGLPGNANEAAKQLHWSIDNSRLRVSNPTPYFVTLGTVTYNENGKKSETEGRMISPGDSQEYKFKDLSGVSSLTPVSYTSINDYGAFVTYKANEK